MKPSYKRVFALLPSCYRNHCYYGTNSTQTVEPDSKDDRTPELTPAAADMISDKAATSNNDLLDASVWLAKGSQSPDSNSDMTLTYQCHISDSNPNASTVKTLLLLVLCTTALGISLYWLDLRDNYCRIATM